MKTFIYKNKEYKFKTMEEANKSIEHWITNAQEELADSILYLEKLKQELRKKETLWHLKNLKKE